MIKSFFASICLLVFSTSAISQHLQELKEKLKNTKDVSEQSKILTDIGSVFYYDGDFTNALNFYFQSLSVAQKANERKTIAVAYHGIGSVYLETEKYGDALKYLEKAQVLFSELNENASLGRVLISLGNVYYMQLEDSMSEVFYWKAVNICNIVNDSSCLVDGYNNLGSLYFEMGNRSDTLKGVKFIKKSMDYISKTDTLKYFQYNLNLAELYTYSNYLTEAKTYLDVCANLLPLIKSLHIIDDYYYCLHQYHKEKGDFKQALVDYKNYKIFQDSILNIENSKQLFELNVKYETKQKEEQIKLLNTQQEKNRLVIQNQRWALFSILLLTVIISILTYILFTNYRKKQLTKIEQELQSQKEVERIRIARDMHDEIGAGLTRIVMRSEQVRLQLISGKELKNGIVESLEKMASESRLLSHNIGEIIWALNPKNDSFDNLFAYIRNYAYDYLEEASIECEIHFPNNLPIVSILPELRRNIFLIVKEALNNIVKHSEATKVEITLLLSSNHFSLSIKDNGKGITNEILQTNGNGLGNMKKRTEEAGGKFIFESKLNEGINIVLENIPLQKNTTKV